MSSVEPTQYRYIDYEYQYINKSNYLDAEIQLSRISNKLLEQIGNNLVLQGLDAISLKHENEVITVDICKGSLIQDFTYIEILNDFSLSIQSTSLDFDNGYLIIYTDFKYLHSKDENKLSIYLDYIPNTGIISSWNEERYKIVILAIEKCPVSNEIVLSPKSKYLINDKLYYYKGHVNYNLINIHDDWTQYLDFFEKYNLREYHKYGNLLHEHSIYVLNNDYYYVDIQNKYDYKRLMIDFVYYDNDETSDYFGFWKRKNSDIKIQKTNEYIKIKNESNENKQVVVSLLDDIEIFYDTITLNAGTSNFEVYDLSTIFPTISNEKEVSVKVYEIDNGIYEEKNDDYMISKYNNQVEVRNNTSQQLELCVTISKNNYYTNDMILKDSHVDYNIHHIFNDINMSELSVYTDIYYLDTDNKYKKCINDDVFIVKFESFLRIYNCSDRDLIINNIMSKRATNFIEKEKCCIEKLLYINLLINKIGSGNGHISSNVFDFDCGDTCDLSVDKNFEVELTANPDTDSVFVDWYGCDRVDGNKCYVRPNIKRMVTAKFIKTYQISINQTGNGVVYSSPVGLDSLHLNSNFEINTDVLLVGVPDNKTHTTTWEGTHIGHLYQIHALNENKTINVVFGD